MRWLKPNLRSSIYGLLGNPVAPSDSIMESGTEDIREAMLAAIGDEGSKHFSQVTRRIRYANDIQSLWYLRGDLMAALGERPEAVLLDQYAERTKNPAVRTALLDAATRLCILC